MNLELINNIISKTKESGVIQNFVKKLEKYMKESTLKVESKEENILDQYRNNFNFSIENNNKIATERNSILDTYAKNTEELGALNYVSKKEDTNSYRVIKIENGKTSNYIISKDKLPNDIDPLCPNWSFNRSRNYR